MNLPQLAESALERLGERVTMDFEGKRIKNTEVLDSARRFQASFEELGLGRGSVCALYMFNAPLIYSVFQGIFRTGATAVPVMFQLTAAELRYVLEDTRAVGVVTDMVGLMKTREAVAGLESVRWVLVLGGKDNPQASPPEIALESLLARDPAPRHADIDDADTAVMLYTSGTTGKPKGVMLTHANLLASARASNDAQELNKTETPRISISAMPMAHIFGVAVMNAGYLVPDHIAESYGVQLQWFEPRKFMAKVQEHRCNTMASVPTMLALILSNPDNDKYDMTSLEEVVCGAAPLPVDLAQRFMKRYDCFVREIYGMTENAGIGSANRRSWGFRPGSAGKAYFNNELRILDDEGNPVATGAVGEIVTRGDATMKGYHNRPEETAKVMGDGWLRTGDLGYLDEDGWLYVVDRKKDMIIKGGENIYPAELESVIYKHPAVAEAAVVGVPHPVYGESIAAFVTLRKGAAATESEIKEHMAQELTRFKIPSRIKFVEALPKSGVGKILRRELRALAGVEAGADAADAASEEAGAPGAGALA